MLNTFFPVSFEGIVSEAEYREHDQLHALRVADFPSFTHSFVICLRSRRFSRPIDAFIGLAESQAQALRR